jgi:hypothetical protein
MEGADNMFNQKLDDNCLNERSARILGHRVGQDITPAKEQHMRKTRW